MQPNRNRLILATLLSALALGAFLHAAAAQAATPAPRWSVAGKTLGANETHFITAKIYTTVADPRITLIAAGRKISCAGVRVKQGVLLGSAAESAGKGNGVVEFFGNCKVEGNGTKCKIEEPIVTNPLKAELVETEKAEPAKEKGSLLTLFEAENAAKGFVTLHFEPEAGGTCTIPETIVSGEVAGEVRRDPENGELGTLVELGQALEEKKSGLINFPVTVITKVTKINGGVVTEAKVKLTTFSETAAVTGTALVLLAKRNAAGEFESETTLWSALP